MSFDVSGPQLPAPGPQHSGPQHSGPGAPAFGAGHAPSRSLTPGAFAAPQMDAVVDSTFDEFFEKERRREEHDRRRSTFDVPAVDDTPAPVRSLLARRRSVRHFLDDTLAPEVIDDIVQHAAWAPSGGNDQDWKVSALSPDVAEKFLATHESRGWAALVPKLHSVAKRRLGHDAKVEDSEALVRGLIATDGNHTGRPWMLVVHYTPAFLPRAMWRYFLRAIRAPMFGGSRAVAARDLAVIHGVVSPRVAEHSVAMYLYALALSATERGVGSCIQYSPTAFGRALRAFARIPKGNKIVGCVFLGHVDETSPAVQNAEARAMRLPVVLDVIDHSSAGV